MTYRTVDAQDLMQAAGLQYTESVMLAEVLNTQTKEGKKPAEILAADGNAEVTRFMSDEEKKKSLIIWKPADAILARWT